MISISALNLLGQEVIRLPAEWTAGEFSREIDVSLLPQGAYFLRLQSNLLRANIGFTNCALDARLCLREDGKGARVGVVKILLGEGGKLQAIERKK